VLGAQDQRPARHRAVDRVRPAVELMPDRGADEVGAVSVEALVDEQIDLAQVDQTHVDGDLLALVDLGHHSSSPSANHPTAIL
jgi:hypothetical protein